MSGGVRDLVRNRVSMRVLRAHFLCFCMSHNSTGPPGDVYRTNHGLDIWQRCDFSVDVYQTSGRRHHRCLLDVYKFTRRYLPGVQNTIFEFSVSNGHHLAAVLGNFSKGRVHLCQHAVAVLNISVDTSFKVTWFPQ